MSLTTDTKTRLITALASGSAGLEVATVLDGMLPSTGGTVNGALTLNGALSLTDGNQISLGTTNGTMIGNATNQKLALWNATPVIQPAGTGELIGMVGNSATAANAANSTSNGNTGATAYSFNDVVKALKQMGALAK